MTSTTLTIAPRIQAKLKESIEFNPVTIVVGPTGCGKSTQVPTMLLDHTGGGPILCSQPRRLAVVAIAKRVAELRGVEIGDEVGYQVGHDIRRTSSTGLVFTTAGLLLEEIRARGGSAVTPYKVIIMDECHERSSENDIVLALLRSLLRSFKRLRLVLMSATFDHLRYQRYFRDVPGCEHISTITLETAESVSKFHELVQTQYLQEIKTKHHPRHLAWSRRMRLQPNDDITQRSLSDDIVCYIEDLVQFLHLNHDSRHDDADGGGGGGQDAAGTFLIFATTYRHLEQLYDCLKKCQDYKIDVMHSSIDMDHILRSMGNTTKTAPGETASARTTRKGASDVHRRKVLLASAIADSSVTIPGVTVVIDLCRSLAVEWDYELQCYVTCTTWTSKSICDQRRGRTGRTCPGTVYRLVHQGFYMERLQTYEQPKLVTSSCRKEVLKLLCAGKNVADPAQLLRECMDPPPERVIQQAIEFLHRKGACVVKKSRNNTKNRITATKSGRLMSALSFPPEDSLIILHGARLGLLYEILALRAIDTHQPSPIVHYFANPDCNLKAMMKYYPLVDMRDTFSTHLAQLSAFMYWDRTWNHYRCKAALDQFAVMTGSQPCFDGSYDQVSDAFSNGYPGHDGDDAHGQPSPPDGGVWRWTPLLEEKHALWCAVNEINPTGVRAIAELMEHSINVMYHSAFEPGWLRCSSPCPSWRRQRVAMHDMLSNSYGSDTRHLVNALTALCGADWGGAARHASIYRGESEDDQAGSNMENESNVCLHYLNGNCRFGSSCRYAHVPFAVRPPCKLFALGKCRKGKSCLFAHNDDPTINGGDAKTRYGDGTEAIDLTSPIAKIREPLDVMAWYKGRHDRLMLLGEGTFEFTAALIRLRMFPAVSSTLKDLDRPRLGDPSSSSPSSMSTFLYKVDTTRIHRNEDVQNLVQRGRVDTFAWNFPRDGDDGDEYSPTCVIQAMFQSLALLFHGNQRDAGGGSGRTGGPHHHGRRQWLSEFWVALTLHRDQFSRWNVLQSAMYTGWWLENWGIFRAGDFPGYRPRKDGGVPFDDVDSARCYVFRLSRQKFRQVD